MKIVTTKEKLLTYIEGRLAVKIDPKFDFDTISKSLKWEGIIITAENKPSKLKRRSTKTLILGIEVFLGKLFHTFEVEVPRLQKLNPDKLIGQTLTYYVSKDYHANKSHNFFVFRISDLSIYAGSAKSIDLPQVRNKDSDVEEEKSKKDFSTSFLGERVEYSITTSSEKTPFVMTGKFDVKSALGKLSFPVTVNVRQGRFEGVEEEWVNDSNGPYYDIEYRIGNGPTNIFDTVYVSHFPVIDGLGQFIRVIGCSLALRHAEEENRKEEIEKKIVKLESELKQAKAAITNEIKETSRLHEAYFSIRRKYYKVVEAFQDFVEQTQIEEDEMPF